MSSTSFYNRYMINNKKREENNFNKSILKNNYTLDYSDYEKLKIYEQYNKLYSKIYNTNLENKNIDENKKIYNLSLNILFKNAGKAYINILNDLSIFFSKEQPNKNINTLGFILTKDDNLLYIGLLFFILSILLWFINVSE